MHLFKNGKKKKRAVSIACFIDGTGNGMISCSNIYLMFDSIRRRTAPWPDDALIVAGYYAGPGAGGLDYSGLARHGF